MTHKLLQLGHDVQNRRRADGAPADGRIDNWQLSWVELCRYKRGFRGLREVSADCVNNGHVLVILDFIVTQEQFNRRSQ